ncbi:GIY-YIG nuclease family protein [Lonsdalea iberica]|uniref:GIY-YIG nuclease family protein n=1 Tax=Lonsdalea iberica TaxID=1082703 RepID=UPI00111BF7F2|nr:GIY-YIG nuclease family protein [Lonsdalea iberica]
MHNPLTWVDPLGLTPANTPGYNVYGLFDNDATKPYYVGITNNLGTRAAQHRASGRLTPGANMQALDRNVTYGEARGYEQYYIEKYETKTGIIGQDISPTNRGNKINSYNHDSETRDADRQKYFEDAYNSKKKCAKK